MKLGRRSFFAALLAAPAVAAVPLPAPVPVVLPRRVLLNSDHVIHSALRQLGILTSGELAPDADFDAAMFHFRSLTLEREWVSESALSIALAARLECEYFRYPEIPQQRALDLAVKALDIPDGEEIADRLSRAARL